MAMAQFQKQFPEARIMLDLTEEFGDPGTAMSVYLTMVEQATAAARSDWHTLPMAEQYRRLLDAQLPEVP